MLYGCQAPPDQPTIEFPKNVAPPSAVRSPSTSSSADDEAVAAPASQLQHRLHPPKRSRRRIVHRLLERPTKLVESWPKLSGDPKFECIRAPDKSIANPSTTLSEPMSKHHAHVTLGGYRGRVELRDSLVVGGPRRIVFRDLTAPSQPRLEFAHRMLRCREKGEGKITVSVYIDGRPTWAQGVALQTRSVETLQPFSPWQADLPVPAGRVFDLVFDIHGPLSPANRIIIAEPVISGFDSGDPSREDRNVLLIIVDAMRGDTVGSGRQLPTSVAPTMDAWMAGGVGYSRAMSVSNQTRASTLALLQAQPPSVGQFHATSWQLKAARKARYYASKPPLLTRRLAQTGHRIAHIGHNRFLWASAPIGLDHGFDQVVDVRAMTEDTTRITDEAIQWLRRRHEERFFLTVNYTAPHNPYAPPEGYVERVSRRIPKSERRGLPRSYLGEIAYVDDHVTRLKAVFDELALGPDTLVVITADHGETFHPKHACWSTRFNMQCHANHGLTLYDEEVHVPLAFVVQGQLQARTSDRVVSHLAFAPTVLDILGLSPDPRYALPSLLSEAGHDIDSALAYLETRAASGIRTAHHKLIVHHPRNDVDPPSRIGTRGKPMPLRELFDLRVDPWETRNLLLQPQAQHSATAGRLEKRLDRFRTELYSASAASPSVSPSKVDSRRPEHNHTPSDWRPSGVRITGGQAGVSYYIRISPARCSASADSTCVTLDTTPSSVELRGDVSPSQFVDYQLAIAVTEEGHVDMLTRLDGQAVPSSRWKLGPFGLASADPMLQVSATRLSSARLARARGEHPPHVAKTHQPELFFWQRLGGQSAQHIAPENSGVGNDADDGTMSDDMRRILKDLGYTR